MMQMRRATDNAQYPPIFMDLGKKKKKKEKWGMSSSHHCLYLVSMATTVPGSEQAFGPYKGSHLSPDGWSAGICRWGSALSFQIFEPGEVTTLSQRTHTSLTHSYCSFTFPIKFSGILIKQTVTLCKIISGSIYKKKCQYSRFMFFINIKSEEHPSYSNSSQRDLLWEWNNSVTQNKWFDGNRVLFFSSWIHKSDFVCR